jgi:transcriptional regulator with XRE-family HTH domain
MVAKASLSPFGARVRAARRARELTQFEVGRAIGRGASFICCVEKGYVDPSRRDRRRLARVLKLKGRE